MTDGRDLLTRLYRQRRYRERLSPENDKRITNALGAFVNGRVHSLDEAFDLNRRQGHDYVKRNALIIEAASTFFAGMSRQRQAQLLYSRLNQYQAKGWLRERTLDAPPCHRQGKIEWYCWHILRCRDHVVCISHLRALLRRS